MLFQSTIIGSEGPIFCVSTPAIESPIGWKMQPRFLIFCGAIWLRRNVFKMTSPPDSAAASASVVNVRQDIAYPEMVYDRSSSNKAEK